MTPADVEVDAIGLACPMPLLKAKRALNAMQAGQRLRVLATDQGSVRDFQVFAEQSGHHLLESAEANGVYSYLLQKRG
jgi:tRNA 2-thiouridine synthesizing protein A